MLAKCLQNIVAIALPMNVQSPKIGLFFYTLILQLTLLYSRVRSSVSADSNIGFWISSSLKFFAVLRSSLALSVELAQSAKNYCNRG